MSKLHSSCWKPGVTGILALFFGMSISVAYSAAPANHVAHWAFDEGITTVLGDSSGNGWNGTLQIAGKIGGALALSENSNVSFGDITPIKNASQVSLAAWIKRSFSGAKILLGKQSENN